MIRLIGGAAAFGAACLIALTGCSTSTPSNAATAPSQANGEASQAATGHPTLPVAPTGRVSASEAAHPPSPTAPVFGTGDELIPIESDNVTAAGYNADTATMTVEFDSGEVYAYSPVSVTVWTDFVNAQPHPWSKVGKPQLVDAKVPYTKVSD